jgi:hypothetical protein
VAHGSVCERCAMCDGRGLHGSAPRARQWTLAARVFRGGAAGTLSHSTDALGPHVKGAHGK